MEKEFHPQLLEDAAAWLFWTQASCDGFGPTLEKVLQTQGQSLLDCDDSETIFSRYPLEDMSATTFAALRDAVAAHAYHCAASEENLIGMIYNEDRFTGRAPSAADISTSHLDLPLTVIGDTLPEYGMICLRHPLPAVVFGEGMPPEGFFRVADTTALGFSMPLWLDPHTMDQIDSGVWLLTGIFYIPENRELAIRPWSEVIPNAVCTTSGMTFKTRGKVVNLEFVWDSTQQERPPMAQSFTDKLRASALGRLFRD
ncbi:hypothetical protein RF240_15985 [Dickeya dadantii]|uniref:hypothetical protein n=1 Tax=Dickeya dadantii TaxID=204038 RepID=UPI0035A86C67